MAVLGHIDLGGTPEQTIADGKSAIYSPAGAARCCRQTHWVENIGSTTLHFIVVELKNRS